MDVAMFLFRENTSLRRWKPDRVAFLKCVFGIKINTAYNRFLSDKKNFVVDEELLAYGYGEFPSHGRTRKKWGVDVDRLYMPYFVNKNHWISMCINIAVRKIEVFDCKGRKSREHVEKLAILIPKIVKAVQPPGSKNHRLLTAYSIVDVPMKRRLNKSSCDYGVYALKFIEAYLLGLDTSMIDDEQTRGCRMKIAYDLWKAGADPVLIERMSKYEPPVFESREVVEIDV